MSYVCHIDMDEEHCVFYFHVYSLIQGLVSRKELKPFLSSPFASIICLLSTLQHFQTILTCKEILSPLWGGLDCEVL